MAETCWYHDRYSRAKGRPITYYARHECPDCGALEIIGICEDCEKDYRRHDYSHDEDMGLWNCDFCADGMMKRCLIGKA
jgi:predicted RNA-binding Zn-ribbon protein involved in translation (DUF1610 family)